MLPLEVIALVDEVAAHLARGDLVGLGPITLDPHIGEVPDIETAARVVLEDVADYSLRDQDGTRPTDPKCWAELAGELRGIEREITERLARRLEG